MVYGLVNLIILLSVFIRRKKVRLKEMILTLVLLYSQFCFMNEIEIKGWFEGCQMLTSLPDCKILFRKHP